MPLVRKIVFLSIMTALCVHFTARANDNGRITFPAYDASVKPFMEKNCIGCHGPEKVKGQVRLDRLIPEVADEHVAEAWQEVLDVLNAGEMPPEDEPQPNREALTDVIESLTNGLFEARKRLIDTRKVTIRRLNRREYANTMRDLLGVPIDTTGLPQDGKLDGFDTIGDAQFMSTIHFEKYLQLGRLALDRALVAGSGPDRSVVRVEPERDRNEQARKAIKDSSLRLKELADEFRKPHLGDADRVHYEKDQDKQEEKFSRGKGYLAQPASRSGFVLDLTQVPFGGQRHDKDWAPLPRRGRRAGAGKELEVGEQMLATLGDPIGRYVARFRVGLTCRPEPGHRLFVEVERADAFTQQRTYVQPLGTFEVTPLMDQPQIIEVSFENVGNPKDLLAVCVSELNPTQPLRRTHALPDSDTKPYVWVDWLEVEGPLIDRWPPKAWSDTFFKGAPDGSADESAYARAIIERFAFNAFRRRAPSPEYIDKLHGLYLDDCADGASVNEAIKETLAIVLASPSFVYVVEAPAAGKRPQGRLSDLELASRLSYFLWSHPPDEALYALAEMGHLSDPEVLRRQVDRMLDDPKSKHFVEAFASQWLELDWLDMIVVDDKRYPDFSETLRRSFREESIRFFDELIRHDLSATNLIDSDFVVIDGVLSRFYGLDAGDGSGFRRVSLPPDSTRVITYRLPTNSLLKEFRENPVGAHPMTHFGAKNTTAYQQLVWRDRKLCELFATLLDKMKATKETDGSSLLDNALVVMGSGLRTGHRRRNLPLLIAGGGGGGVRQGRHFVYREDETPLGNLWLSMLKQVGCPIDSFADSNGVLDEMFV